MYCHFRGHPLDLIRSGTGEMIRECVTWTLASRAVQNDDALNTTLMYT